VVGGESRPASASRPDPNFEKRLLGLDAGGAERAEPH